MVEHLTRSERTTPGGGSGTLHGISRRVGLPCRADLQCDFVAKRPGMSSDAAVFRATIADRDQHELDVHAFVFSPPAERPPFATFAHARAVHQRGGRARWAKGR